MIYFYTPIRAGVAEWQTHQTQNLAVATSCGFKSHLRHQRNPHGYDIKSWSCGFFFYFFREDFLGFLLLSTPISTPDMILSIVLAEILDILSVTCW